MPTYDVSCGPAIYNLYYVEVHTIYTQFFIVSGRGILSNAFTASIEIIIWFLSFILLMWFINSFADNEPFLHPWN